MTAVRSSSVLAVPMPVPADEVVELRLALVLYGGVSLAVYMHGVTLEIHDLVIASSELEPGAGAASERGAVPAYRALLEALRSEPLRGEGGEARTRVVVDVIAGTSAGGINGVALGKALARDLTQDGLRDLWLVDADIDNLLAAPVRRRLPEILAAMPHIRAVFPGVVGLAGLPVPRGRRPGRLRTIRELGLAGWHLRRLVRDLAGGDGMPVSVLDGSLMSRLGYDVLRGMRPRGAGTGVGSLLPPDHLLELFVTTTDYSGWKRYVPIERQTIRDVNHRHVLRFTARGPARDGTVPDGDFGDTESQTGMLAFAARATASFPGAFPSTSLTDFAADAASAPIAWDRALVSRFFRPYELDDVDPYGRRFVDGGVLDNMPFGHAIRAIRLKPASTQVKRRLVYIEPDPDEDRGELPGRPPAASAMPTPSLIATAKQALSAIPLQQSVLDELLGLREANETAARIRDVVDRNFDAVGRGVPPVDVEGVLEASGADLAAWWRQVDAPTTDTGAYLRLKVQGVVEAFAEAICRRCDYPQESNYAFFVREVLRVWAGEAGLYDQDGTAPSDRQVAFLRRFDIGYRRRRVRFLIDGVSGLYPLAGTPGYPARRDLDQLKAWLYARIALLEEALDAASADDELARLAVACFARAQMQELFPPPQATSGWRLVDRVAALEAELRPTLSALEERLGSMLEPALRSFNAVTMQGALARLRTASLPDEERQRLVVRFVGFARWDPLTYPLHVLGGVGELDVVQIVRLSPRETRQLSRPTTDGAPPGALLRGATIRHFGAFFQRAHREHDYLWGRLDAAEQLVDLLTEDVLDADRRRALRAEAYAAAFAGILAEERDRLTEVRPLFAELDRQLAAAGGDPGRTRRG